ncbi:translation initiation factor IF-2 subunit beta [Candidatus Woesearchaeota archaeon]|nr:translation initiation factor IF-2 subunit beta [Candidatus Woesearchaeota archaeon]
MEYKEMLKKVRESLPQSVFEKQRFEIPNVKGHVQGNRTILSNFLQIAGILRREPAHLLKFVLKELATPGEIKRSGSVIIGAKAPASSINEKIRLYAQEYVLCYDCGKPDTKVEKEGSIAFLKCQACGVRHPIKSRI